MNRDYDFERTGEDAVVDLHMNRREFLGLTGAGIFLFFTTGALPAFAQERPGPRPQPTFPADFNAYLKIGEDGRVTCYTGKIEMGQGVVTSLAQMLADELDAPLDVVDMVMEIPILPLGHGDLRFHEYALLRPGSPVRRRRGKTGTSGTCLERLKTPVDVLSTEQGVIIDTGQPAQGHVRPACSR
jgi:isoquinoline 1-oxidoreductase